jgi:hypothetical protein
LRAGQSGMSEIYNTAEKRALILEVDSVELRLPQRYHLQPENNYVYKYKNRLHLPLRAGHDPRGRD